MNNLTMVLFVTPLFVTMLLVWWLHTEGYRLWRLHILFAIFCQLITFWLLLAWSIDQQMGVNSIMASAVLVFTPSLGVTILSFAMRRFFLGKRADRLARLINFSNYEDDVPIAFLNEKYNFRGD